MACAGQEVPGSAVGMQHMRLCHLDVGETDQTTSGLVYFMTMLHSELGGNNTLQLLDLSRPLPTNQITCIALVQ
jgi:hypothetical protein